MKFLHRADCPVVDNKYLIKANTLDEQSPLIWVERENLDISPIHLLVLMARGIYTEETIRKWK